MDVDVDEVWQWPRGVTSYEAIGRLSFADIKIVRSPYVPEGTAYMVSEGRVMYVWEGFMQPPKPTLRERLWRWVLGKWRKWEVWASGN